MSDAERSLEKSSRPGVIRKVLKWLLVGVVLFLLLSLLPIITNQTLVLLESPFHLAFGWVSYLGRVIPQTQINVELLLCSLGALVLGMLGLQGLMSRLVAAHRWPWRFTLAWCGMLIVMFCTSIAAVGIVHQAGWLFRLPTWIEWRGVSDLMKAMSHAKQVSIAAKQYAWDHEGRFPDTCADMMHEIVTDSRIFWVSVDRNMPLEPLVYAGAGMRDTDYGDLPFIWSSHLSANGFRVVAHLDGSCEVVREERFQVILASFQEHWAKQQVGLPQR